MANTMMMFPDTVEEFMEQYKIVDTEQIYTNGAELVPIFRMEQWFEYKGQRMKPQYLTPEQTYNYLENICRRRVTENIFEVDGRQKAQNIIIKQILERLEVLENNVDREAKE